MSWIYSIPRFRWLGLRSTHVRTASGARAPPVQLVRETARPAPARLRRRAPLAVRLFAARHDQSVAQPIADHACASPGWAPGPISVGRGNCGGRGGRGGRGDAGGRGMVESRSGGPPGTVWRPPRAEEGDPRLEWEGFGNGGGGGEDAVPGLAQGGSHIEAWSGAGGGCTLARQGECGASQHLLILVRLNTASHGFCMVLVSVKSFRRDKTPKVSCDRFYLIPNPLLLNLDPFSFPPVLLRIETPSKGRDLVDVDVSRKEEGDVGGKG